MPNDGLQRSMLRALNRGRPEMAVGAIGDLLAQQFDATQVSVLLANYQLTALRPVLDPEEHLPLDGSAAGEAFITQQTVVDRDDAGDTHVYLPVSVHGDRLGIVALVVPGVLDEERRRQLADLATLAGYALSAISRHTDLLHCAARSQRLSLAAELQWQLLPARGCLAPEYELAGHLEPAYAVHADNFDWSQTDDALIVSVTDAAHRGRTDPLLTTLAVTAARNARRSGLSIAEQAAMVDQAVYAHHQGDHTVETISMSVDITTGHAAAVKTGSPQILLIRAGVLQPIELVDQLPLGMFEGSEYKAQTFELATGDRVLLVSDGVIHGLATGGGSFPHQRLLQIADNAVNDRPAAVVRALIDELIAQDEKSGLDDDATVVCLDWHGSGEPNTMSVTGPVVAVSECRAHLHALPDAHGPA